MAKQRAKRTPSVKRRKRAGMHPAARKPKAKPPSAAAIPTGLPAAAVNLITKGRFS